MYGHWIAAISRLGSFAIVMQLSVTALTGKEVFEISIVPKG